jgi:ligand-binding sensor domain-containing protein/signal transduction histidine kinase
LFRHLESPRDLPSVASAFAQDKTGMIWIGTQDGLVRWDGYRSRVFRNDPQDPLSLPGNYVTCLTVDNEGTLFVVTSSGVIVRFDPLEEKFRPLPAVTTATGSIRNAFISDGKQGLWVGNSNGLSYFNPQTQLWELAGLPKGTKVWSLLLAQDGTLWVGTEDGLLHYNPNTSSFAAIDGVADKSASAVRALFQSGKGEIWFGKNDGAVGVVDISGRVRFIDPPQTAATVKNITALKPGVLSIATNTAGLNFVDELSGKVIQTIRYDPGRPTGIGGSVIFDDFLDRAGGLWIAHEHGADYLAPGTDSFLSLLPSDRDATAFSGKNVTALASRSDGSLWIATEDSGELFSPVDGREAGGFQIPGTQLRAITVTGPDQTWISTNRGLFLREKNKISQVPALADIPMFRLFTEGDVLWINTERRGLVRLDIRTNKFTFFAHDPSNPRSISDNWTSAAVRDLKGHLWVATSHGLNRFDDNQFTQFHHEPMNPNSLPSEMVLTLLVDHENRLWMGTQGGGIAVLEETSGDGVRIRRISREDGLLSNNVGKLIEDERGQIWASTDSGLARIDPKTFTTRSFSAADGVAISAYWAGSGTRTSDGSLLFGGVGGVTIVHPDRLPDKQGQPPPVVITAAHIGGRSFSPLKPLLLPPNDHNVQVDFAALDYAKSEIISYAYKLVGFDKDWTYTDTDHRQAVYTNLPPGGYKLQVRASTSKGVWTDPPTDISVTVLPAWYQTWWFKVCLLLAGIGAVILFVRSRTALLRRRQKELEGQVAERTSEIASLLHNSGEGFLSFGANLVIDRQYSRACETFLGEIPAGKNAAALLFAENPRHAAFITESVPAALAASDAHKKDLILSLLPKEIDRRGRRLRLHYTTIENGHLMVVLRDITTERRLAERVASEHKRLEMIVAAVTDSRDFFDALSSYELFIHSELPEMMSLESDPASTVKEIYRAVHTFKGVFSQFSFETTPALLHDLEEQLDFLQRALPDSLNDIAEAILPESLIQGLEQDLAVIRQALGDEFLNKGGHVNMSPTQAARIRHLASLWRNGEAFDPSSSEIKSLLDEIDQIGSVSLKAELAAFDQVIAQVARRMEKEVAPLVVVANEDVWLDPNVFGPFLRSLIHVFRNCVAHGIEPTETRIDHGKEEQGVISCIVDLVGEQLKIVVADDGAGVDLPTLRHRLKQSGQLPSSEIDGLSDDEILDFVFQDNVSTATSADALSGRGVGLAAVRQEVERLGGHVSVKSDRGRGTSFIFRLKVPNLSRSGSEIKVLRESGL